MLKILAENLIDDGTGTYFSISFRRVLRVLGIPTGLF